MIRKHIIWLVVFILMLPFTGVYARGSKESEYQNRLPQTFSQLSLQVSSGEISVSKAQSALEELRKSYRIPFTDKAGVLNVLLYRIGEGELSVDEAHSLFLRMNSDADPGASAQQGTISPEDPSPGEHTGLPETPSPIPSHDSEPGNTTSQPHQSSPGSHQGKAGQR